MSNLSELLPSGGGQNLVEFVASGTLPNGKPVILNSNGTVTVVAETSTTVTESIPAGSDVIFNNSYTDYVVTAFDQKTAGQFIAVYRDAGNNDYGSATVGTISGTSITFGAEYVFATFNAVYMDVAFDPNTAGKFVIACTNSSSGHTGSSTAGTISGTAITYGTSVLFHSLRTYFPTIAFDPSTVGKFVISYKDDSNNDNGTAVVGTISGTTLTYGSEYIFNTGDTIDIAMAFDPNTAGQFVVVYRDGGNVSKGMAVVGTVTGSTISFGSDAQILGVQMYYLSIAFDPTTANKFILAYEDTSNSNVGKAVIGTVSGTSISYGTPATFSSSNTNNYISLTVDPNTANKFAVAYQDVSNSSYGTVCIGTVSGTSITFGSETVVDSVISNYVSAAFDPNTAGKFVVAYSKNNQKGKAIACQMGTVVVTTNLTATNLIGITSEATSSGGTAKINTWGGINEAQTSLTIASDYYAQTNGTITTATAGQKVGTAISATTINMKDLT